MGSFIEEFDNLKISALQKCIKISPLVKNVTIGPNKTIIEDDEPILDNTKIKHPKFPVINTNKVTSSATTIVFKKVLADIENKRQIKVEGAANRRLNYIRDYSKQRNLDLSKELHKKQQILLNEKQQQELFILQVIEQYDKDESIRHQQLIQHYEELAERKKKIDKELQEQEKRRQQIMKIIEQIKTNQVEFRLIYQEIINNFKNYEFQSILKESLGDVIIHLKTIPDHMDCIINKCKSGKVNEDDVKKTSMLVGEVKGILKLIVEKINEINKTQKQIQQEEQQQKEERQSVVETIKATEQLNKNTTPLKEETRRDLPINKFISIASFKMYSELENFLENYTNTFKDLVENDNLKNFRFSCGKAVNIPVNAISQANSHHLLDKYNRLSNLLSGKTVEVNEDQVCAARHPQGINFCTNLLAKKIILQGDLMISSNPEAAFCYATMITALWNDYPDFGKLFLAYLYKQCPYLVPFYPPKAVGQSKQEYYCSLGYNYKNGVVEKHDKFLKRMTGLMRLYAAIVIAKPKKGQQQNLHGIANGWRWLSSFLNLEPMPDISATMLHVFLEVAGSTLQITYGKIFQKTMHFICYIYLPILRSNDTGGPVNRLESLLQRYLKRGKFEDPYGVLPDNFW